MEYIIHNSNYTKLKNNFVIKISKMSKDTKVTYHEFTNYILSLIHIRKKHVASPARLGNRYHNNLHASDVLQTTHWFISQSGLKVDFDIIQL